MDNNILNQLKTDFYVHKCDKCNPLPNSKPCILLSPINETNNIPEKCPYDIETMYWEEL
jgi:hypothetical protein